MKRIICVLLALLLCPLWAAAEMEMDVAKNYITFPELDGMKGYFRKTTEWTIVHRGNFEEHMDLLMKRGYTEEEIRARFSEDSLLWEAYQAYMPDDALIRMERFDTELSREVWHLRHLSTTERKEFLQYVNDSLLFADYETFSAVYKGNGGAAYLDCGFTTIPPADYESGKMHIRFINGQQYVLSYVVRGRMASRSKLRTTRENDLITGRSPFNTLTFGVKLQPKLPDFSLDAPFPEQVGTGEITVSGTTVKGAEVTVTLDGREVSSAKAANGAFSVTLPLVSEGDHEVVFTASHSKYTTRTQRYTVSVSDDRTPLTLTDCPAEYVPVGSQTVSGVTAPGAEVILRLDDQDAVTLTADAAGGFTHSYDILDSQYHLLMVTAAAEDKTPCIVAIPFFTVYETFSEGLDAFEQQLTDLTISQLAADPYSHLGERVKISVRVKEVRFTETGLGVLCTYNPPKSSKHEKTPLYLTLYSYGQDQIQPNMIMTVYATVGGLQEIDGEERLELLVQYGTYLTK